MNTMENALKMANESCVKFGEALEKGDLHARNKALKDAKDAVAEYNVAKMNATLEELAKLEDPIKEAIIRKFYAAKKVVVEKEKGVELGATIEDKNERIDLVKLCTYTKRDDSWQYKVEILSYLLVLKTSTDLNETMERLQRTKKDYRLSKIAQSMDAGETPTSNNQIGKKMQEIFDALVPGIGKVRKEDIVFLTNAANKYVPKDSNLADVGHKVIRSALVDVLHNIITGERYQMKYKVNTKVAPDEAKSGPAEVVVPDEAKSGATEVVVPAPDAK